MNLADVVCVQPHPSCTLFFFFFLHFLRGLHLPIVEPHDHVLWSVNVWFCGSIVVEIQH